MNSTLDIVTDAQPVGTPAVRSGALLAPKTNDYEK
jgi:hypothetical protein